MAFIYLASPYTAKSELTRHERYLKVSEVIAKYLRAGIHVYSPIVHCHEIARRHTLPTSFQFWADYNYAMLGEACLLHVLQLPGWEKSRGVTAEIAFAARQSIPTKLIPYPLTNLYPGKA